MTTLREALMLSGGGVISLVGAGGKTSLMYRIAHELEALGQTVLTTTTTKILKPTADQSGHLIISGSASKVIREARALFKTTGHITAVPGEKTVGKLVGFSPDVIDRLQQSGVFDWIVIEADGASRMPLKAPADHEPVIPSCTGWVVGVAGLDAVGQPLALSHNFRPERYAAITGLAIGENVSEASIARAFSHERGILKGSPANALKFVFLNKADKGLREVGRKIVHFLQHSDGKGLRRAIVGSVRATPPVDTYWDLK